MKENCPTINQTVKKPRAITEFKLSIGMDFPLRGPSKRSLRENIRTIHASSNSIGISLKQKSKKDYTSAGVL